MKTATLCVIVSSCVVAALAQSCPDEGVHFYPDGDYCDRYSECREGIPSEVLTCPDGLLFNDQIRNGAYPCGYPIEVDCTGRTKRQPAQPTDNCPNQFGKFSSGDRSQCGFFFNCVDGFAHLMTCPEGLAFSSQTHRCEYPVDSDDCDVEDYLGFSCPSEVADPSLGHAFYASPRNCQQSFLCIAGSPRLQVCDLGTVFNPEINACDEPENTRGCENHYPADELKAIREKKAYEAEQREKRRLFLEEKKAELLSQNRG